MSNSDRVTSVLIEMNRTAAERLSLLQPPIRELPEQQDVCFEVLDQLLDGAPGGLQLRQTQLQVNDALAKDFPGLGGVDLTLEDDDHPIALIELKFGSDKLWNSAWDICKLALALRKKVGDRAFMVGGAPLDSWQRERQGPDLFEDAEHSTETLLSDYANCFRRWETVPVRLPEMIQVETVDAVSFEAGDCAYEMRLVEVLDGGSGWLEVHDGLGLRTE